MSYRLDKDALSYNRVVLTKSNTAKIIISLLLGLLGLFTLLPGLLLLLSGDVSNTSFVIAGIGFVFAGSCMIVWVGGAKPDRFVFDNERGELQILEKVKGKNLQVSVAYEEIESFHLRVVTRTHSRSSGGRSSHTYRYYVGLIKNDGAIWSLLESSSEDKANEMLSYLKEHVDLGRSSDGIVPDVPSDFIQMGQKADARTISWKRPSNFLRTLLFICIATGFFFVCIGAKSNMPTPIFWGACGFLFLIVGLGSYRFITRLGARQVVAISYNEISSYQEGGVVKDRGFSLRTSELKRLLLHFSTHEEEVAIYFLKTDEEVDFFTRMKTQQVGLGDIGELFSLMGSIHRVDVLELRFGQMLQIEQTLQRILQDTLGEQLSENI